MEEGFLLETDSLTIGFESGGHTRTVVDAASFGIRRGETLAVVGESGSGKTVTALSFLRLIPSPPGRILGGRAIFRDGTEPPADLLTLPEENLRKIRGRRISMIFQEPMTSLNPVYTCGTQVAEVLREHLGLSKHAAREKVLQLFREVLLPRPEELFRSYPHQLSGGQKQRVMIAMAIACDPALLIADEPTTALDVTVQKTILELLKKLQASRGMSILFITHDLGIVRGFADRVLVMHHGKGVEEGTVRDLFLRARHPYTRGLIASRPPAGRRPERLPTVDDYLAGRGTPPEPPEGAANRAATHARLYAAEPVLTVEGVSRRFGSFRVLENIHLPVYEGETLGIVGESGSGKTTLARVMLELLPASEGVVRYKGTDITRLTPRKMKALRKELQIIFQDPYSSLNPRLAAGPAILEPMKVHGLHGNRAARKEKVMDLLRRVGLSEEHFYRYPHEFSGGQRQRICIARALAVEPRLIICDESVSALDVSIQAQVLNLLNELKRTLGLTYIFISHDLSVVSYMSDRIVVMKEGRIVEAGEADALYAHPKEEYTRKLLEAMPGKDIVT